MIGTVTPGLTDTTQSLVISTKLTKDLVTKTVNGGTCSGLIDFPITGPPSPTESVTKEAMKLSGAASCSTTATGPGVDPGDPAAATGYPPNGKLSIATATQTLSAYVHLTGQTGDVAGVAGTVTKGASVGAKVTGGLWEDPAVKLDKKIDVGVYPGFHNSGYSVDPNALVTLLGCADGTPGTVAPPGVTLVLVGDGASPLLGSPAPGLALFFGE